jgi:hypothetical protein
MLNPVATHFVLKIAVATICGMVQRSDGRNSANALSSNRRRARPIVIDY